MSVAEIVAIALAVLVFVALVAFPSWFLHPVLRWHKHVLGHTWEIVPVGFADWDIHCSCGKVGEL